MAKESRVHMLSMDAGPELLRLVKQRAQQEGISQSDYLRECIYLEFTFSGDREAMTFIVKKIGARVKGALVDRFAGVDLNKRVEEVLTERGSR